MFEFPTKKRQLDLGSLQLAPWIGYGLFLLLLLSTAYSTLLARANADLRVILAFAILTLGGVFGLLLLHFIRWDRILIALKQNSLLFIYCFVFVGLLLLHSKFDQAPYLIFAVLFYFALPTLFLYHPSFFFMWLEIIVWSCAILAAIALLALTPLDNFFGLPFAMKYGGGGIQSSAGIIEHPLTMGPLLVIGLFTSLYLIGRNGLSFTRLILSVLIGLGLVIAQSRGAYLATIAALTVYLTWRHFRWTSMRLYLVIFLAITTPFFVAGILMYVPVISGWLRVEAGLAGREIVWVLGLERFLERPIFGWGLGAAADVTAQYAKYLEAEGYGSAGYSFHNTYITKLVEGGAVYLALYVYLYLVTIRNTLRSYIEDDLKRYIICVTVGIVVSSFYIDISIGGIRSLSVLCAVHLGVANLSAIVKGNYRLAQMTS